MRILAFAYACEPGKGSEPEAGWLWARILARIGETTVITRENNRGPIEAALPSVPEADRLRFVYVDLPRWARWWKRGQRGVRLYYLLWQAAAARAGRRLAAREPFDLVWHLTLANAWLGSLAPLVPGRFVYGPVGGGVKVEIRDLRWLGIRGTAYEVLRSSARGLGRYLNPAARLAWRRAWLILAQNPETRAWFPARYRDKVVVQPHAVVEDGAVEPVLPSAARSVRTAVFAGRLLPWKGLALGLHAMTEAPGWRLVVFGDGPDARRLRRLAQRLGLQDRVEWRGWRPHGEVSRFLREEADVCLHPSLHDDSPFAVAEAMAAGVPVVAVNRGGPKVLLVETGALAPADPRALAHALDGELRVAGEARAYPSVDLRLREILEALALGKSAGHRS